jgi:uncharacterized membrane protein HdeD (DUF308 family)
MTYDGSDAGRQALAGQVVTPLLERAWWAIALRGLLGIIIGLVAIVWPGVTQAVLLVMLGAYFVADGVFALVTTFQAARHERTWWPYLLQGVVSIAVGILAFTRPAAFAFGVLMLAAIRCFITGAVEMATAVWMQRETGRGEWPLWLAGLISVLFAAFLLARPSVGLLTLIWMVGIYALIFGVVVTTSAFRLKGAGRPHLAAHPA